jgi:hypothetical protein
MRTLVEWQELGPLADSVLQAVGVVWWCGAILIILSLLVVLGCAAQYRRSGQRGILLPQSETGLQVSSRP